MAVLAFLLAAIQFALVALGAEFPAESALRNLGTGLFLVALGLLLPGAVVLYRERQP